MSLSTTQVLNWIEEKTGYDVRNQMHQLQIGKEIGVTAAVAASVAEWSSSYSASKYYINQYCDGASEIISNGLLQGTTCIYNAGVGQHSTDTGYWYGSTLNYFIRDNSSFWAPHFGGTFSAYHWMMLAGIILYFVYTCLQILLNQEYILSEQDLNHTRLSWLHDAIGGVEEEE